MRSGQRRRAPTVTPGSSRRCRRNGPAAALFVVLLSGCGVVGDAAPPSPPSDGPPLATDGAGPASSDADGAPTASDGAPTASDGAPTPSDGATIDLAPGTDAAAPADLSTSVIDLSPTPDLAVPPDLAVVTDLARAPDLGGPDRAGPPDLALLPDAAGPAPADGGGDASANADKTPPVISAVVATPNASGAIITWATDEAADSQVQYGPTNAYGRASPLDATLVTTHKVVLAQIAAGTYHFRVSSQDAKGNLAVSQDATFTFTPPPHRRCAWMYTVDAGPNADFASNASWFDALHPVWYAMQPDGISLRTIAGVDDAGIIAAARKTGTMLIPTVAGADGPTERIMLYSPTNRAAHIRNLVDLAVNKGYAGLDLDYEHLWNDADGPALSAFFAAVGTAMHAAGKQISFAAPGLSGPSKIWSYADMAASMDVVHLMGYDYHSAGGGHSGPTAPLGWVDAVAAQAAATGHPERFLLGVPNYGVSTSNTCPLATCSAKCTSAVATSSTHMLSCSYGTWPAPERILNCSSADGTLYFDDTASLELKVAKAKAHALAGITYWAVGNEPTGFFAMVQKYY